MARARSPQDSDTAVDTQPEFATHDDARPVPAPTVRRPVKRARVGVVVLTVLLTELVLIAAGLNQAVSKHVESYAVKHPDSLLGHAVRSLLVLRWRFSPMNGQSDLWHTELITVGLVLLLGIVLVPLLVHGPMSWLRAFVGTWFAVIVGVVVATVAAVVLSDLEESRDLASYVVPGTPSTGVSIGTQIGNAVFGPLLAYAFVAGAALGVVTALVVSLVAVSTRRADPVPVAVASEPETMHTPDSPQPFFGNTVDDDSRQDTRAYGAGGYGTGGYGTSGGSGTSSGYGTSGYGSSSGYGTGSGSGTTTSPYGASSGGRDAEATTAFPARRSDDRAVDETSALPRVGADKSPVGPPSSEATADPPPSDATTELPRSEARSAADPDSTDAPADTDRTQAWPAQPDTSDDSAGATSGDADRTAAFPVPPDDEDLGRQPDRTDD